MSEVASPLLAAHERTETPSSVDEQAFFRRYAVVILIAWLLAALMPLQLSIVAVLLFAGPHNWVEARYFLSRLPARLGPLKPFFAVGFSGVALLGVSYMALPMVGSYYEWSTNTWLMSLAIWNSVLLAWVTLLTIMRSATPPRRNWPWVIPVAFALGGIAWLMPGPLSVLWLFVHPLMSLWILDREIHRSRRRWSRQYRRLLWAVPFACFALMFYAGVNDALRPSGEAQWQVARQSGTMWLPWIEPRLLVSLHAFLELVHYGVWLWAIPLVSGRVWHSVATSVPIARKNEVYRNRVTAVLVAGAVAVIALWLGFVVDYTTTRDVYFAIAMGHVLAEIPFLLRAI